METKDIRFIDSKYNELFRIKDGESITVTFSDGSMSDRQCTYIDDYHTKIGYNVFHICEFAELMERGGSVYRPKDIPMYELEKIEEAIKSGKYEDIAAVEWLKPQVNTLVKRLQTKWNVKDASERVMHFDIQREDELFSGWNDEEFGEGKGLDYFVNQVNGIDIIIGYCVI